MGGPHSFHPCGPHRTRFTVRSNIPEPRTHLNYLSDMPGKVPQKPNEKKKGKTLKEKRAAKKAKKG